MHKIINVRLDLSTCVQKICHKCCKGKASLQCGFSCGDSNFLKLRNLYHTPDTKKVFLLYESSCAASGSVEKGKLSCTVRNYKVLCLKIEGLKLIKTIFDRNAINYLLLNFFFPISSCFKYVEIYFAFTIIFTSHSYIN